MERNEIMIWGVVNRTKQEKYIIPTPIKINSKSKIVRVQCGQNFFLVLNGEGKIYSWGKGGNYRLGILDVFLKEIEQPTLINYFLDEENKKISHENVFITSISAGYWNSACIDKNGNLYFWGKMGSFFSEIPKKIKFKNGEKISKVSCGCGFLIAISTNGKLYSFGKNNKNFVLGFDFEKVNEIKDKPKLLDFIENDNFIDVSCGFGFSLCLKNNGDIFSFGDNEYKNLGIKKKKNDIGYLPSKINLKGILNDNEKFIQVSCSKGKYPNSGGVTNEGRLFMWGSNYKFKLGFKIEEIDKNKEQYASSLKISFSKPILVPFFSKNNIKIKKVQCGGIHNAFLSENNELFMCGCGSDGRLGFKEYEGFRYLFKICPPKKIEGLIFNDISLHYYSNIGMCEKI